MAAKTSVKVAVINNAAKDDTFTSANDSGLSENGDLMANLAVLANDPGAAKLLGVMQDMPSISAGGVPTTAPVGADGFVHLTAMVDTDGDTVKEAYDLKLKINADGTIDFDLTSLTSKLDYLADGETLPISFYYLAQMANGAYSIAKVTVEISGTNDAPVLTLENVPVALTEGDGAATLGASGDLTVTDADRTDVVTVSFGYNGDAAWSGGSIDGGLASALAGGFTANGSGWSFSTSENLDFLADGETITLSFTVTATDDSGTANDSDSEVVTVTITGTNDAATFSGANSGNVYEDGTLVQTGTLTATDLDHDQSGLQAGTQAGTYGSFEIDANGNWTYTLDNDDADLDSLGTGDSDVESFTVKSIDGTEHTVSVTIHGADEPVVITGDSDVSNDYDDEDVGGTDHVTSGNTSPGNPNEFNGTNPNQNDIIIATNQADTVNAGGGNDTIYGRGGDDNLKGQNNNDVIYAGSGNDTIFGGNGTDVMTGGSGNDTFLYTATSESTGANKDTITDFLHGYDKIDLQGVYGGTLAWGGSTATANGVWVTESAGMTLVHVDVTGAPASDDMVIQLSGTGLGLTATDFTL